MLKLYVLRHGKAINPNSEVEDYQRKLNKKGCSQINQIGYILKNQDTKVNKIISSKARRTFETTSICNFYLNCDVTEYFEELYLCNYQEILDNLSRNGEGNTLLYVGHNNGISDFVNQLCGENITLSTGMLVEIELNIEEWRLISAGVGSIQQIITPEVLTF